MNKRNWARKRWERVREKVTALRDEIPAALTLNTYYTCYAIDKFILYLYRDRIYDVLYVILYLYGLLHTLSPKLPFHRAAERTWVSTRKAQESRKEGGRKGKRQILEKEAWTASNWYTDISLSLRREVPINSRDFRVPKSLLRKIVTVTGSTEKIERSLMRKGPVWKRGQDLGARHENPGQQNLSRIHRGLERTIKPWIQPADRRQNAGASSRSPAGRRLINGDKRDENGFDLSDERERD